MIPVEEGKISAASALARLRCKLERRVLATWTQTRALSHRNHDLASPAVVDRYPPDGQADRALVQSRLWLLLLPRKGEPLSVWQALTDVGRSTRRLREGLHRSH